MRLRGKSAIVTGAAHGIGHAIAELFAEQGAHVVLADIDDAAGEATIADLRARNLQATYCHVDVSDDAQVAAAVRRAADMNNGHIDILVNNASYLVPWHDVVSAPREEWDKCYQTALLGAAR